MKPYDAFFHLFFRDLEPGDFPFKFSVEVTNYCNLRCTTCPRKESGRGFGHMDLELFESLADQAAGSRGLFYPQGFGESLLHPQYKEMLAYLKSAGVRYPVCITNGTQLDEKNCRTLINGSPRVVIVSLDGGEKEVYEDIRVNADFDKVVANVERFLRMREEAESRYPHVILSVIGTDTVKPTLERLRAHWEPLLRRTDDIYVCTPITWAGTWATPSTPLARGEKPEPSPPPGNGDDKRPPCRMLYKTLTVFYDGRATPCCYDHECKMEVGNAREESVTDIWKGERLRTMRRLHEEGRSDEIELCRGCPEHMP